MRLLLVETSSNQKFIFDTNKLKENMGASELIYATGTKSILEIVQSITNKDLFDSDLKQFRYNLLNQPEIDQSEVEVILATSGKALLLVRNEERAKEIIHRLTKKILAETPGLKVYGVISADFELSNTANKTDLQVHKLIAKLHREYEKLRAKLPSPEIRFQRLPVIAECQSSGLPANHIDKTEYLSQISFIKRQASDNGVQRFRRLLKERDSTIKFAKDIDELEKGFTDLNWMAVIHADGNGLGQIFLNFENYIEEKSDRNYLNQLRQFSLALDICTENAFLLALEQFNDRFYEKHHNPNKHILPVIPLIVGGDDLTVICDGRYALKFTYDFLRAFEDETSKDDNKHLNGIIPKMVGKFNGNKLTSCAGIAIVKPHFPFYRAYSLAEALLKSAKQVKTAIKPVASAIDYQVIYDSSNASFENIREHLKIDNTSLIARPYIVSDIDDDISQWSKNRKWQHLEKGVNAINKLSEKDPSRRDLPNSLLHQLREELFNGRDASEAKFALALNRYKNLKDLSGDGEKLFWSENEKYYTYLLDVLDIAEFWE